jgi:hypothetical protein
MIKATAAFVTALTLASILVISSADAMPRMPSTPAIAQGDAVGVANGCGPLRHYSQRFRRCVAN